LRLGIANTVEKMYVIKVKHQDTLRRIVLDEAFTYEAL
jgi:hypothetical protein